MKPEPVSPADAAELVMFPGQPVRNMNLPCHRMRGIVHTRATLAMVLAATWGAADVYADESFASRLSVTKSEIVFNPESNTFDSTVTLTNVSAAVVAAPLMLEIKEITSAGVKVANRTSTDYNNHALLPVYLTFGVLRPGARVSTVVKFSNPQRASFDYFVTTSGGITNTGAPASRKFLPGGYFFKPR